MVEDSSTSDDNSTTNKGVNVRSESLPVGVHRCPDNESSSCFSNIATRSFADIKNEIQNVLDLMGPTTPNLTTTHTTSSEADNEESVVSLVASKKTRRTVTASDRRKSSNSGSTCANNCIFSEREEKPTSSYSTCPNKDSVMADIGSFSSNNFDNFEEIEHSCCNHTRISANPECMCMMGYNMTPISCPAIPTRTCEDFYSTPNKSTRMTTVDCRKRTILEWIKDRSVDLMVKKPNHNPCDLYKINICGQEEDGCPPKRVVFDLVEGIPKPSSSTVATNTIRNPVEKLKTQSVRDQESNFQCASNEIKYKVNETIRQGPSRIQKNIYYDSDGNARVDFYYFDHGNANFFHTTDTPPVMKYEIIAEKTERYTTKFWAEFFASIHIGVSFCISFILQFFKFLLYSMIRPVGVGLMQMTSDYCFKPFLTTFFNGLIQPFLIFLYNIATSIRDLCDPIAEAFGYFCRELAVLFRAIRLCTYKKNTSEDSTNCDCKKRRRCEC